MQILPLSGPLTETASGLFRMDAEHYHASSGVSKSMLDDINLSPLHLRYRKDHPEAETEAMRIGHWTHTAVFEPHLFEAGFTVTDEERRGTNAWKAAEAKAAGEGRKLLKRAEYQQIVDLAASVRKNVLCQHMLESGAAEVSAFAEDFEAGLLLRSRIDWLPEFGNAVVDLKTCVCAAPQAFARIAAEKRYHVQAAFYLDQLARLGIQRECFVFIAVEKEPPYPVAVYQIKPEDLARGQDAYRKNLTRYQECVVSDRWPGYGDDILSLSLPAWATRLAA